MKYVLITPAHNEGRFTRKTLESFSYGEKDYYLGGFPLWQLFRVAYRSTKQPIDGLVLPAGYSWAAADKTVRNP